MIIAIDGPAGSGKSTVSKLVAQKLGFTCLDTGAMYRALAWLGMQRGVSVSDGETLGQLAQENDIEFEQPAARITIAGRDVTQCIRTAEIDAAVSPVSAHSQVRAAMVGQQRRIGHSGNYVVEGRDIGTVVFPDAEVKVYLTASAEERARRRVAQNEERGVGSTNYDEVLAAIKKRDELDSTRQESPLRPADDAVLLDSDSLTINDVTQRIVSLAQAKLQ